MKLAILIYGYPNESEIIKQHISSLQKQLNATDIEDLDVVHFMDSDGESIEAMKKWLLEQTTANKYVFVDKDTEMSDNFLILRYNAVKYGWKTEKLIELGIYSK